jgi:choline dehydrogenase-like flavoprotein
MIYVIGSGPAGVSSAYALVNKGLDVTMLDSGIELEPERLKLVQELRKKKPTEWSNNLLSKIKDKISPNSSGIPLKYVYGSDFPYREVDKYIHLEKRNVEILPSLAKGGLSNVWGAAVLPYRAEDITDWPITIEDLKPHYEAVFSFMDLSATRDDLGSILPLYSNTYQALQSSRQAVALMEDLNSNKEILNARGFIFGYSRLAVRSYPTNGVPGCAYCGLCMYGCPYQLIYDSSHTLIELQRKRNFRYIKNIIAERLVESNGEVTIFGRSRLNNEKLQFKASRVYLACGVLFTTKILLESLESYDHSLTMRDSQYFLLPLLKYRKTPDIINTDLHTLSQIFIELFDQDLSNYTIHLQVYTYNDLFYRAIKKTLGLTYPLFKFSINELLGRLLLIQGFLHSNISPTIAVRLSAGKNGSASRLVLEANSDVSTKKTIKGISAKLFKNRKYFSAIPIPQLLTVAKSGRSFHSGGTFPMRENPLEFESDCLGRPYGFKKVHIVDATTFPSIPATTITLTVMANAHRISSAYDEI